MYFYIKNYIRPFFLTPCVTDFPNRYFILFVDCTDLGSMSVNEKVARSVALEQAYVHDVYELFCDNPKSKPWPRVQHFLETLEPGSLVCDVGCGNGKYLNINSTVFNMGGDKCIRLSEIAREKDNEVILYI